MDVFVLLFRQGLCLHGVRFRRTSHRGRQRPHVNIAPDFDAIPDTSKIVIDANDAWNAIVESMDGDGEICTARVFLMTYVKGDDDPTHDAMKWFFSLNEGDNLTSLFDNGQDKPDNTPARLFAVDCANASVEELDAGELAAE